MSIHKSLPNGKVDWQALSAQILSGLDIRAEYIALGVEFVGSANGDGWAACRAFGREDKSPSAGVNLASGIYKDHGGNGESYGLFDFASTIAKRFTDWRAARKFYAERAGVPLPTGGSNGQATAHPTTKKPKGRGFATAVGAINSYARSYIRGTTVKLGEPAKYWPYHDVKGKVVGAALRFEFPDRPKEIRPLCVIDGRWYKAFMPSPRPLLGFSRLANEPVIYVVEGEGKVDAAQSIGLAATCSAGGASSAKHSDWTPLAGKRVTILPDNDEPGRRYAATVARILRGLTPPATVRVVPLPGVKVGGDIVDWLAAKSEAADPADLRAEIEALPAVEVESIAAPAAATPAKAKGKTAVIETDTVVYCADRGNYGKVVEDRGASCLIHFESPEGVLADVEIPKGQLRRQDGAPLDPDAAVIIRPMSAADLVAAHPHLRPPIIDGLLRSGETGNIVSTTKVGKSWLVYSLLLSVAMGRRWLDTYACHPGRVLLIDNELHVETLARRLAAAADAMQLGDGWQQALDVVSLRGRLIDLYAMGDTVRALERGAYSLIALDSLYRALPPGVNENDNAQITQLFNVIDAYAAHLNAAWVSVHHSSKGDQSGKQVTDVGSGAGSQSRAPDLHFVLRPHELDDVVVGEAAVRSFAPVSPLCLRWEFPLWMLASNVDPRRLRQPAKAKQQQQDAEGADRVVEYLQREERATARQIRNGCGIGSGRCERLLAALERDGRITHADCFVKGNQCAEYYLQTGK